MVTIDWLEKSFLLTDTLFDDIVGRQVEGNRFMERGNIAEFHGGADAGSFRLAFSHLSESVPAMKRALNLYDELLKTLKSEPTLKVFDETTRKLYQEAQPFQRISQRDGARYSDLGKQVLDPDTDPMAASRFDSVESVLEAQREDLKMLLHLTERTLGAFEGVLPLTEKGEFVQMMLSGRSSFSDFYEELVYARSTFTDFYTKSCMVSIQAVMQTYPAGFEFLSSDRETKTTESSSK